MGYIYTIQYCSNIKKDEMMPCPVTGKMLEVIILSEVGEIGKDR